MGFYPGFDITAQKDSFGFCYGRGVFGPEPEIRCLNDIRASLEDPHCNGPEMLYAISMDVGMEEDREEIMKRNLLYGAVTYAAGMVGREPVRSQAISTLSALLAAAPHRRCMRYGKGRRLFICRSPERIIRELVSQFMPVQAMWSLYPPCWVHATVNADVTHPMTFGAWCIRNFGFEYGQVRRHGGIAHFPYVENGSIMWRENPGYRGHSLEEKAPREYVELGIQKGKPIYTQFRENKDRFSFVTNPQAYQAIWEGFRP